MKLGIGRAVVCLSLLWSVPALASDEVNAASLLSGARPTDGAWALVDGTTQSEWEPSIDDLAPVVLTFAEPFDVRRIEVVNSRQEADWPGLSVKRMRLETAPSAKGPWTKILETELKKGTAPQSFPVQAKAVRHLRFTSLANYGSDGYHALGELKAWGARSRPREVAFNGTWHTTYGEMVLTQTGQRITGCYGHEGSKAGDATVEGTLEGAIFSGTWCEREEGESEGRCGPMIFAHTQEGELSGVWGHSLEDRSARWDGTPLKKATITCERPEKRLAAELEKNGRVVLRGILFDTGKDVIKPESVPVLESLALAMQNTSEKRYLVEGHTDDRGGESLNLALSEKRAASVKAWLVAHGIPAERLATKGFGQGKPVMPNDSEAGRAANRRVEVSVQ